MQERQHKAGDEGIPSAPEPMPQEEGMGDNAFLQELILGPGSGGGAGGGGSATGALPDHIVEQFHDAMGVDVSGVRMNVGGEEDAELHGALGFAAGQDVVIPEDSYAPGTRDGDALLAHEVVHTLQSGGGGAGNNVAMGAGDDVAEAEADDVAARVLDGEPVDAGEVEPRGAAVRPKKAEGQADPAAELIKKHTRGFWFLKSIQASPLAKDLAAQLRASPATGGPLAQQVLTRLTGSDVAKVAGFLVDELNDASNLAVHPAVRTLFGALQNLDIDKTRKERLASAIREGTERQEFDERNTRRLADQQRLQQAGGRDVTLHPEALPAADPMSGVMPQVLQARARLPSTHTMRIQDLESAHRQLSGLRQRIIDAEATSYLENHWLPKNPRASKRTQARALAVMKKTLTTALAGGFVRELRLLGHGSPGRQDLGNRTYRGSAPQGGGSSQDYTLLSRVNLRFEEFMMAGATVRIEGCSVLGGEEGRRFAQAAGQVFLGAKRGYIYGSKVDLRPTPGAARGEIEMPRETGKIYAWPADLQ